MDYGPTARAIPWPRQNPRFILWFWWDVIDGKTTLVGFEMRSVSALWTDERQNRAAVESLVFEQHDIEPHALRASDLREVALLAEADRARRIAVDLLTRLFEAGEGGWSDLELEELRRQAVVLASGHEIEPTSKRGVLDEGHFREVAAVYTSAAMRGEHATRAVQEHFTERWAQGITRSQAAKWVYRARHEFGLLGPTEPRQQGGIDHE